MLILNDHEGGRHGKEMRNHGSKGGYRHECLGYNSRLDELQAAILLTKLKRIDEYNPRDAKRRPSTSNCCLVLLPALSRKKALCMCIINTR